MSAVAIAADVNARRRTAVQVASEALARIEAYSAIQPATFIERVPDVAVLDHARGVDRRMAAGETLRLAGVPFAIKDNIDLAGLPTTAACPQFAYRPERSAFVVERLIAAGAIPVGKTNLDQFATGLNGTRSPYGALGCVFNRAYISGGSSSGSAVAVGAGLVPIALGTDTAGSSRVPAAFNHLVGLKPSKGRWSSTGLLPACRSLDCVTVFAREVADARLVDDVVAGFDPEDDYSRPLADCEVDVRLGIAQALDWCGDAQSAGLYAAAIENARKAGYEIVPVDIAFLREAAALLYSGPWVAERTAAVEPLLNSDPGAIHPVVRSILRAGAGVTGVETFRGLYRLQHFSRQAERMWSAIDALLLPTAPTIYRIDAMLADPIALNANLGRYTNWVNLLDMSAVSFPAGFRDNRTGFGVTLMAPAGTDRALLYHAERLLAVTDLPAPPPLDLEP
jgi:allophanate hydrolase